MDNAAAPRDGPAGSRRHDERTVEHEHAVQFYDTDAFLCGAVVDFLAAGAAADEPLGVFATTKRWTRISARLDAVLDVDGAVDSGLLNFFDAEDVLASFMRDGTPDETLFRGRVGRSLGQLGAASAPPRRRVRIYAEIVDLLCQQGNPDAAIRLERLWNGLEPDCSLTVLCGYAMRHFRSLGDAGRFLAVCGEHTRVVPAETPARAQDDASAREISRLQQRACALETEVEHRAVLEVSLWHALAERRRTAEALRAVRGEADLATRAKSDFLAVMSHEFRTPLNAIIGYQGLLREGVGGAVTPRQRHFLDRADAAARKLLRLVNHVLSLTRIEGARDPPDLEEADVALVAGEVVRLLEPLATAKGLSLRLVAPPEGAPFPTDAGKLEQILLNLVSNAIQFTDEGSVDLSIEAEASSLSIEVRDTGIGIAPANLDRVFDRFVQLDPAGQRRGAGLGLRVSRDLARHLGGELTVESRLGQGSAFTLRLCGTSPEPPATAA